MTVVENLSLSWFMKAGNQLHQGTLATTLWSHNSKSLARLEFQRNIMNDFWLIFSRIVERDIAEFQGPKFIHLQQRVSFLNILCRIQHSKQPLSTGTRPR